MVVLTASSNDFGLFCLTAKESCGSIMLSSFLQIVGFFRNFVCQTTQTTNSEKSTDTQKILQKLDLNMREQGLQSHRTMMRTKVAKVRAGLP